MHYPMLNQRLQCTLQPFHTDKNLVFSWVGRLCRKIYKQHQGTLRLKSLWGCVVILVELFGISSIRIQYSCHKAILNYMMHNVYLVGRVAQSVLAGWSGDRIPVGARFFAHVQTGPGAHAASCTMGTGYFPGVKRPGRGADHPPPS
jgi:hypothetical protein